jgi:hypothetical protein
MAITTLNIFGTNIAGKDAPNVAGTGTHLAGIGGSLAGNNNVAGAESQSVGDLAGEIAEDCMVRAVLVCAYRSRCGGAAAVLSEYVCMCVCMYVCVRMYLCGYVSMHVSMCGCSHTHTNTYVHIRTYTHTYIHTHTYS